MKTIKDAVIELGGEWPKEESDSCFGVPVLCECIQETNLRAVGDIVCCGQQFRTDYFVRICNQQEFETCAKRLGYINGYRWGVEYPTNGKRPDLPYDVLVCFKEIEGDWDLNGEREVWKWNWIGASGFKITDQRYKPADTSYLNAASVVRGDPSIRDELNLSKSLTHGEEGLTHKAVGEVSDLIIALSDASNLAVDLGLLDRAKEIMSVCNNIKAKSEREKVIDAAEKSMLTSRVSNTQRKTIKRLYDLGMLVLPQKKSDTKD